MGLVELKLGDMFDGPCDLIVLPCSTSGTITSFVRRRLTNYRIPYPQAGMELGDVAITPFEGGESIAQYVAYACSVKSDSSSADAILRIGRQLGLATVEIPTVSLVSVPLLGAGAGGLSSETVVEELTKGFKETSADDARLVIHLLDEGVFRRHLQVSITDHEDKNKTKTPPLRVFISYCHTSPAHEKWAEHIGLFMRENGVDARMDIWHLRRGMDLPQFMTNELAMAQRVVLISDERYAEKADGRVGGVGWETMIIQGDMSQLPPEITKYLVVVRGNILATSLPRYLKTKFVIHWPDDESEKQNKEILLRELYDIVKIPALGRKPLLI